MKRTRTAICDESAQQIVDLLLLECENAKGCIKKKK